MKRVITIFLVIFVYSLTNAQEPELVVQMGHTMFVSSVCFSPDGKYALSGSWDNTLKLWNISTGKEIRTFIGRQVDLARASQLQERDHHAGNESPSDERL